MKGTAWHAAERGGVRKRGGKRKVLRREKKRQKGKDYEEEEMVGGERRRLSKLEIKGMRRKGKEEIDGDSPKPARVKLALIWSLGECLRY